MMTAVAAAWIAVVPVQLGRPWISPAITSSELQLVGCSRRLRSLRTRAATCSSKNVSISGVPLNRC